MIEKHEVGDVIWYEFNDHIAFDLETLISSIPKEKLEEQLHFLN